MSRTWKYFLKSLGKISLMIVSFSIYYSFLSYIAVRMEWDEGSELAIYFISLFLVFGLIWMWEDAKRKVQIENQVMLRDIKGK